MADMPPAAEKSRSPGLSWAKSRLRVTIEPSRACSGLERGRSILAFWWKTPQIRNNRCYCVTGALMALGLKFGKALNDAEEKKQETYSKTRVFFSRFAELNGSVNCKVLLGGLDMNDPEDHKIIMERKLFDVKCEKYVIDAVDIVETI